jgi:ECF sigma factor
LPARSTACYSNKSYGHRPTVTELLLAWSDGDRAALERLTPLVYQELKKIAEGYLRRERAGHTLQPTALAHEAYLKLIDQQNVRWRNRAHFYGIAAQAIAQPPAPRSGANPQSGDARTAELRRPPRARSDGGRRRAKHSVDARNGQPRSGRVTR